MLLLTLEAICTFLFGYLIAIVFTHENEEISATFFIPALIAEVFLIFPIAIIRAGSWSEAVTVGEEWKIIEDNWHWALIGFTVFWAEQGLSTLLDVYEEDDVTPVSVPTANVRKGSHMGSSSSNFHDKSLDIQSTTIVKLTHAAFGHLDRQVSASIEANLNIRPNQPKTVQRLLAEVMDQKPSVPETLRPLMNVGHGRHNAAYGVFDKVCMIAAHSQKYSQGTLNNLISIAQQLDLSQEEIYYLFKKSRLAV